MRRLIAIAIPTLLVLTLTNICHAQLAVGIRGGLNISSLAGDVATDSKTGILAGAFVGIPLKNNWGIQPEISYVQKGAKREFLETTGGSTTETTKLDYIELQIPIGVDLPVENENINPRLYAGPTVALALSCEEVERAEPSGTESSSDCKDDIKTYDFGLVFGFGVELGSGRNAFIADLRYDVGIANINDAVDDEGNRVRVSNKNRSTQLLVGYRRKL